MPRRAPRSPRRPIRSSRLRQHGLAGLPLLAGFLGALALDGALERSEAAPLVPLVFAVAPPQSAATPQHGGAFLDVETSPAALTPPVTAARQARAGGPSLDVARAPRGPGEVRPPRAASTAHVAGAHNTTRERALEATLHKTLVDGKTPYAATVLLEAHSGRVLAIAEHSTEGPAEGLALEPMAPAASVFKVVTSAALLEAGVAGSTSVCTHGGRTRMQPALLVDNGKRDRDCRPFSEALPHSLNVAIAKLALKHLEPDGLRAAAARWGFDAPLPAGAGLVVKPSRAMIPDDPFGFAEAAAGFGDVKLSAMHGAVIASIVANQGLLVPPHLSDDVQAPAPRRVVSAGVAKRLQSMMTDTVKTGTGRRVFTSGARLGVTAAGKTGSLANYDTGLDTSWFVGFAPAERPEVVVASVVVNTARWHVKAPLVAKEALRAYFKAHPPTQKAALVASRR